MVGRELAISLRPEQPSLAREDPSVSPRASKEVDRGSRLKRLPFTKKGSRPARQASKKGKRVPKRRRAPGPGVEDFFPWVAPISSHPPSPPSGSEEEEKEDEMANLIHNFGTRKNTNGVPVSSGQLMLPLRLLVRLINTQPMKVRKSRR